MVAGVASGHGGAQAVAQAASWDQDVLTGHGCRISPRTGLRVPPSASMLDRLPSLLDADEFEAAPSACLAQAALDPAIPAAYSCPPPKTPASRTRSTWTPPGPGLVLLLCWPQRPRSAVAPALRTRPCHTGTRARPRLSTPAIFHPMPTAARRPAAAGYRWPASHPVTPSARPGMTHREERGPCADGSKAPITPNTCSCPRLAASSESGAYQPVRARSAGVDLAALRPADAAAAQAMSADLATGITPRHRSGQLIAAPRCHAKAEVSLVSISWLCQAIGQNH